MQPSVAWSEPDAPCTGCGYDLTGIVRGRARVTCPECGLDQPAPAPRPAWRGWKAMALRTSLPTLALCSGCFVLILVNRVVPVELGAVVALLTLLSGPSVPVLVFLAMSPSRDRDDGARYILLGWLWNLLIGAAFVGLACVWPYQWTMYDETAFW